MSLQLSYYSFHSLQESISTLIAKYHENGYLDYLTARWYHGLPCMRTTAEMYRPSPLSIKAVAGVFIMLCLGIVLGCIILFFEHFVYKHVLPDLRKQPKGTIWKSPNLMFFSQVLHANHRPCFPSLIGSLEEKKQHQHFRKH